jgi:hypothetical protein
MQNVKSIQLRSVDFGCEREGLRTEHEREELKFLPCLSLACIINETNVW